jgi:hypothetical protein
MKNIFLIIISIISFSLSANCQNKGKAEVTKAILNGDKVELTITNSTPFYFGGNIFILHIGKKEFSLYHQGKEDGKGILTFLIPATEFAALNDGSKMWLTYGNKVRSGADKETGLDALGDQKSRSCWKLGKFNKSILTN